MADVNQNFSVPVKKIINPEFKDNINREENIVEKSRLPERALEKEKVAEQLPEKKLEVLPEQEAVGREEYKGGIMTATRVSQKFIARQKRIESILEQDLEDVFRDLPASKRMEFKLAGEQTAREINTLLEQAKIKANRILELIKKWLLLIPGVNKFFIEQEAKIKADEILKIKDETKE